MKTAKIIFFAIIGLALVVMGMQSSMWRKKAAKAKAEASKAKHKGKVDVFKGAVGSIRGQISIARKKKGDTAAEIEILEADNEKITKKIEKSLDKIKAANTEIVDFNSALAAARKRRRK